MDGGDPDGDGVDGGDPDAGAGATEARDGGPVTGGAAGGSGAVPVRESGT